MIILLYVFRHLSENVDEYNEVFEEVINASEELSYTLQTVTQNWKI